MATSYSPPLGLVIGQNVARLRKARGWSQRDLIELLNRASWNFDPPTEALEVQDRTHPEGHVGRLDIGGSWSSASLSLLENKGARGERLSDLATLCSVLEVPLQELLASPDQGLEVDTQGGHPRRLNWIRAVLQGQLDSRATGNEND